MEPSLLKILLVVVIVVLLFGGGGKLSGIMGDMGKGVKAFKRGLRDDNDAKPAKKDDKDVIDQ